MYQLVSRTEAAEGSFVWGGIVVTSVRACAKIFGHAPLIEGHGSRVLLGVQNDEKWTANIHRDRFLSIY